ncbi:MAG: RlmE family RNA methyltransferase [Desulfobacterales bacterium]|jgi:23S rRNA (uridine2552-2'-O)-methyltransferase|nr:RlmE family RNA methyltransferase [Desulfobacterales bacterium]
MKRFGSKKHQRWADHYSEQAKKERYPARSVYKLKQAQRKFRLIRKDDQVLDLGCSPGSWLLYAAELTGKHGKVLGIDLKPVTIKIPSQAETLKADILTIDRAWIENENLANRFNVVLSDMAPATTGNKMIDAERSYQLCQAALNIAQMALRPDGSFICKIFQGEEFKKFSDSVRSRFKNHKIFKPQSSRKESKEIYIIGMNFNG